MLVNAGTLSALFIGLKTIFNDALKSTPVIWDKIAMKVPSSTGTNDYGWLSDFPKMRRWIGAKNVKSLEAFKYSVKNEDYEATVEVDRNDIEDDQLGIYNVKAKAAGKSTAALPDEIVMEVVNGAFTNLCFDGKPFISAQHKVMNPKTGKLENVSNLGNKKLSCDSLAAAAASYGAARIAMRQFKDDEGRPLNINPNVLLVPVALGDVARQLMNSNKLGVDTENPYKGTATVVEDARLTSDTAWFLLDTSQAVMPFIYQERKAPEFVQQTDPQADDVFSRKKYKFGAEARAAGGYGFWQTAFGSDGTAAAV